MKTLLVPTDFSEAASKAIKYATDFALLNNYKIKLLHINQTVSDPNMPPELVVDILDQQEQSSKEHIAKLKEDLENQGIQVDATVLRGFSIAGEIETVIKENKVDMVVMGTRGTSDIIEKLLGSNASWVMDSVHCPVLVVPQKTEVKPIKKIVFATQFRSPEAEFLNQTIEYAKKLDAEVTVLKINTHDEDEGLLNELNIVSQSQHSRIVVRNAPSVSAGLIGYLENNEVDLLTVIAHKRNLLEKVFTPSLTKKLAEHIHVPLLAYHI
ncbi:universal stress protein [Solitalea koreensis]|uniref:Nucleotide-binding universal stress protein, UspA family n=1 Tax=Solitalea koreensis TaxID=543615 RepID=A0A521DIW4_9SPHI|nr:universal stress protein [Solitalea koreensis]SMO71532.1 Nucleotide-binding universal stress protein, UspA family [Solitalea koreensis]